MKDSRDNGDGTITVNKDFFNRLLAGSGKLAALEVAGVDNWDGYSIAMEGLTDEERAA